VTASSYSIEFWLLQHDCLATKDLIKIEFATGLPIFIKEVTKAGGFVVEQGAALNNLFTRASIASPNNGGWYHVDFEIDVSILGSETIKTYLNGVLSGSTVSVSGIGPLIQPLLIICPRDCGSFMLKHLKVYSPSKISTGYNYQALIQ
jgi:hypothetical protein